MSLSNLGLDAFTAIAKHKTVLEASKHLGVSQTAVTQRLKSLETELRSSLFIRSRKGMKLTDAGVKLLTYCKQRQSLETQTISSILNEGKVHPVRISISGSTRFMYSRVLPSVSKVQDDFPNIFFSFDINDDDDKLAKLKKGEVDFTFLPRESVALELDSKLLRKSKYILVGGRKYKKHLDSDVSIIDYSVGDNFTSLFFEKHKLEYQRSKERHYINNTMMLPSLLEKNFGVAVLDLNHFNAIKNQYEIYNLLPTKSYEIEWALVWLARAEVPDYFQKIINSIK